MTKKDEVIHIRLDPEMNKQLRKITDNRGISKSSFVREALEQRIDSIKKTPEAIRKELIFDNVSRYVDELRRSGSFVVDVTSIITEFFWRERSLESFSLGFLLVFDPLRHKIWLEIPPPIMMNGSLEYIERRGKKSRKIQKLELFGDVFEKEDFGKKEIEVLKKLRGYLFKKKRNGVLRLHFEPNRDLIEIYKSLSIEYTLLTQSGEDFKVEKRIAATTQKITRKLVDELWKWRNKSLNERPPLQPLIVYIEELGVFIFPDKYSKEEISSFSDLEREQFIRHLVNSWKVYLTTVPLLMQSPAEKNLIMMKLNKTTGNKLKEALKQGFASSIEHAVYDAVNFWLKKSLDEKQYSVKPLEGRPYIAEALDDGLFKNVGEVIEEALNNLEWRLSR